MLGVFWGLPVLGDFSPPRGYIECLRRWGPPKEASPKSRPTALCMKLRDRVEDGVYTVKVGNRPYDIDVSAMEYFRCFINFQLRMGQKPEEIAHSDIPYFDIIHTAVSQGFREFFNLLPLDLEIYLQVTDRLDQLWIPKLRENLTWRKLQHDLKVPKSHKHLPPFDPRYGSFVDRANDAAFRFLFHMMRSPMDSNPREQSQAFHIVAHILTRPLIFGPSVRAMTQKAYTWKFGATWKQQMMMLKLGMSGEEWNQDDGARAFTTLKHKNHQAADNYQMQIKTESSSNLIAPGDPTAAGGSTTLTTQPDDMDVEGPRKAGLSDTIAMDTQMLASNSSGDGEEKVAVTTSNKYGENSGQGHWLDTRELRSKSGL